VVGGGEVRGGREEWGGLNWSGGGEGAGRVGGGGEERYEGRRRRQKKKKAGVKSEDRSARLAPHLWLALLLERRERKEREGEEQEVGGRLTYQDPASALRPIVLPSDRVNVETKGKEKEMEMGTTAKFHRISRPKPSREEKEDERKSSLEASPDGRRKTASLRSSRALDRTEKGQTVVPPDDDFFS